MNNKMSLPYLILIIANLLLPGCGAAVEENENNLTASFVPLRHVANEKYLIDRKESVVTWKGSMLFASKST